MPAKTPALILGLVLLATGLVAAGSGDPAAQPAARAVAARPNIVVVLTDDQDLILGSMDSMPKTRSLIGAQGATFSQYFVPTSLCCPSRATILTGKYIHNHGVFQNFRPDGGFLRFKTLGNEEKTLAASLQQAGYRTALLGKYLNEYPVGVDKTYVPPGWDEWFVPAAGSPYGGFNYTVNDDGLLAAHGKTPEDYLTDVLSRQARDFMTRSVADQEPFFLLVAPFVPHKPAVPAPRHAKLFVGLQAPRTKSFNERDMTDKPEVRQKALLTAQEIGNLDILYRLRLRTLQAVDEMVAELVESLRQSGQLGNTYIFFTSDNGFHMGQHRMPAGKYTPYEEDIHVPLLVRGPGVRANLQVGSLAMSVDLAPTIAELTGTALLGQADGRSLARLLRGKPQSSGWRKSMLLEQYHFVEVPQSAATTLEPTDVPGGQEVPTHLGLRTATFKYVEYESGELEYYDLVKDPNELQNLARTMSPAFLERLSEIVKALSTCAGAGCRAAERTPLPKP
jgi:N-acetylglucosamine-6-sulfatase